MTSRYSSHPYSVCDTYLIAQRPVLASGTAVAAVTSGVDSGAVCAAAAGV